MRGIVTDDNFEEMSSRITPAHASSNYCYRITPAHAGNRQAEKIFLQAW